MIYLIEESFDQMISNMEGDIYERIRDKNAIVRVTAKNGERVMAATGFFYGIHDFIITAGQVAAFASPANNIKSRFQQSEEEFACTTAFVARNLIFTVLRVANSRSHGFMFCSPHFSNAMNVYAIGYQDNDLKISKGTVTSKGFASHSTDARADNGFSGGVIVNASVYEAVGVINDCTDEPVDVTYFTPCGVIHAHIMNYNNSPNTVQIPNLDEHYWPDSILKFA